MFNALVPMEAFDPSALGGSIVTTITDAVQTNATPIIAFAGGLIALAVVVKLVKKFAKP